MVDHLDPDALSELERTRAPGNSPAQRAATEASDDVLLDRLQRAAFDYFLQTTNPQQRT